MEHHEYYQWINEKQFLLLGYQVPFLTVVADFKEVRRAPLPTREFWNSELRSIFRVPLYYLKLLFYVAHQTGLERETHFNCTQADPTDLNIWWFSTQTNQARNRLLLKIPEAARFLWSLSHLGKHETKDVVCEEIMLESSSIPTRSSEEIEQDFRFLFNQADVCEINVKKWVMEHFGDYLKIFDQGFDDI